MYDINLPSHRSLFQIQAERLVKIQQVAAQYANKGKHTRACVSLDTEEANVPWYIMTSDATHIRTKEFFESHHYWGLKPSNVFFFNQVSTCTCVRMAKRTR
jgi:UDP-N-acetylglucosamine/UDP-N-acetylgalactosamine diphosphorylase